MSVCREKFIHLAVSLVCPVKPIVKVFLALNLATVLSFIRSDNVCQTSGCGKKTQTISWKEARQD